MCQQLTIARNTNNHLLHFCLKKGNTPTSFLLLLASSYLVGSIESFHLRFSKKYGHIASRQIMSRSNDNGVSTDSSSNKAMNVAIIGAGAAGLATARVLDRAGVSSITVFEKDSECAGVWRYNATTQESNVRRPMYRGLKTNLPKEIMGYREFPWQSDEGQDNESYVTHGQVYQYLKEYAQHFGLRRFVKYDCVVQQLTIKDDETSVASVTTGETLPMIELAWAESVPTQSETNNVQELYKEAFDAVFICNGHYAKPAFPNIPGLDTYFKGQTLHSIQYDDPSMFAEKVVLCVGGRASGSDLAREISAFAKQVYLSDSKCPAFDSAHEKPPTCGNVTWVPPTVRVSPHSIVHFKGKHSQSSYAVSDIDVIIFCTGYDYQFPFIINPQSNLELHCVPSERRVSPLYEQLWHAQYPNVAFIGLPHSILPFPFFELQAEAVVAQLLGTAPSLLPSLQERLVAAKRDAESGGPRNKRVQDTHYLGDFQWDYCRKLAKLSGRYDEAMENYIATNKAIYDHSSADRKRLFPGGPDTYRYTRYTRNDDEKTFRAVNEIENGEPVTAIQGSVAT